MLADISNQTGDPVFDDALNTALRLGLEQTPYLNVLATDKVRGTLTLLKLPVTKVTPEIARQVCLKTNSKMVIASSVEDAGNGFGIELNAIDCQSGTAVARGHPGTNRTHASLPPSTPGCRSDAMLQGRLKSLRLPRRAADRMLVGPSALHRSFRCQRV